jgi:hypothetical protein
MFNSAAFSKSLNWFEIRIDIQGRVCRLKNNPREDSRKEVEQLRQHLVTKFLLLPALSEIQSTAGVRRFADEFEEGGAGGFHDDSDGDEPEESTAP